MSDGFYFEDGLFISWDKCEFIEHKDKKDYFEVVLEGDKYRLKPHSFWCDHKTKIYFCKEGYGKEPCRVPSIGEHFWEKQLRETVLKVEVIPVPDPVKDRWEILDL